MDNCKNCIYYQNDWCYGPKDLECLFLHMRARTRQTRARTHILFFND